MDKDTLSPRHNDTDISLAEENVARDLVSSRRRLLIKASAATVPVIMTLRSGAAAATSIHDCIERDAARARDELGPDDKVFGDDPGETALDEWVRIVGKAGRKVVKTSGGKTWYCIRNKDSSAAWDDINGWDCYDETSTLVSSKSKLKNYWPDSTNFYCVNKAGAWECLDEQGAPLTPTVPADSITAGKDVYLLIYVGSFDGQITGTTFYPKIAIVGDVSASPITGSCLCSVDPNFNILG